MTLKHLLFAVLFTATYACSGSDGLTGPVGASGSPGAQGAQGAPGKDGVVNYAAVFDTIRAVLPPLVKTEVAKQVVNPPTVNVDSIIAVVRASLPAPQTVDVEAIVARVKSELQASPNSIIDIADITRRVQTEIAKTPNIIKGDLMVEGRVCVFAGGVASDASLCAKGTEVSIFGQGANISLVSNWFGTDAQYPGERHQASLGLDPDGGLRIRNNTNFAPGLPFYNADRPTGYAGFDSQTEWSWYQQAVGQGPLGTQSLVLRTDWGKKEMYFASWREGWNVGVRTSGVGCKWCENLTFTFPALPK